MSDLAVVTTPPSESKAPVVEWRAGWRRPPGWLWPVSIAGQLALAALLTSYTYFFVDDFIFLQQARTQAFGSTYLRESLYEHFSPITRVLNKVVVDLAPGSFGFAHGVQLALYAAAIAAFALVVRTILGRGWGPFALTLIFGQSLFLMRLLNWWTATGNLLPATIFMLLALAGYLRWRESGSRMWLIGSLVAYAGSLLDYETAMLFPVYLVLITLLVLEDSLDPRSWMATLWRERWAWFGYAVLDLAALLNFFANYYHRVDHPSLSQALHFLDITLVQAFVPALLGMNNPQVPGSMHTIPLVIAGLVFCAALAAVLYWRPRAWRCVLVFGLVFLITMLPLGLNRIKQFGVSIGYELYYEQSVQFVFLILTAFALSRRWGGERKRIAERPALRSRPILWRSAVGLGVVAACGYVALYISSAHRMGRDAWQPRGTKAFVSNFLSSRDRVRSVTGHEVALIDAELPTTIMPTIFVPFNRYSEFLPVVDSSVRFDSAAHPLYALRTSGRVGEVRFVAGARGDLRSARVSSGTTSFTAPYSKHRREVCLPRGSARLRLHVSLPGTAQLALLPGGLPNAVHVSYDMPAAAAVGVLVANAGGAEPVDTLPHLWRGGPGSELSVVTISGAVNEVDLDLPGGACVSSVSLGAFSFVPTVRRS